MLQPSHTVIVLGMLLVGAASGWAYADHLQGRLDELTGDLADALAREKAAANANAALQADAVAVTSRARTVQASRESILVAPVTENGSVAPILWRALQAADDIGGVP